MVWNKIPKVSMSGGDVWYIILERESLRASEMKAGIVGMGSCGSFGGMNMGG